MVRREPDEGPEPAGCEPRGGLHRLPARPAERLPQALPEILADPAASWRREPGTVRRFRRVEHDGRQFGEVQLLAFERLLAAEEDAELGLDDPLEAVRERTGGQAGPRPRPGPPGGHHPPPLA